MSAMQSIENALNRLSDIDAGWWPLLRLRPQQDQLMDTVRLLKIVGAAGAVAGLPLVGIAAAVQHPYLPWLDVASYLALACVGFFLIYKFTFALAWNRRARRLQAFAAGLEALSPEPPQSPSPPASSVPPLS
jgi:hypothetical protein